MFVFVTKSTLPSVLLYYGLLKTGKRQLVFALS